MSKDFNEFLNTIDDKSILENIGQYISKLNFSDDSEKMIYLNLATSKALLDKYHQWLNS